VRDGSWASKGADSRSARSVRPAKNSGSARPRRYRPCHRRPRRGVPHAGHLQRGRAPQEAMRPTSTSPIRIELARQSDYLHRGVPRGGPDTRHLVSAAVIDALGPTGTLINVARGSGGRRAGADSRPLIDGRLGSWPHSTCSRASRARHRKVLGAVPMSSCSRTTAAPHWRRETAIGKLMIDNLSAHFAGPAFIDASTIASGVYSVRQWVRLIVCS